MVSSISIMVNIPIFGKFDFGEHVLITLSFFSSLFWYMGIAVYKIFFIHGVGKGDLIDLYSQITSTEFNMK